MRAGRLLALALPAGLVAAAVLARRRLLLVEVVGTSMTPVYGPGDRLLVDRLRRGRRGDVVIARHQGRRPGDRAPFPTDWLVKRLAAVPGDPVPPSVRAAVPGREVVPAGMTVLLGEDPDGADSRTWGFVPVDDIAGVVLTQLKGGRLTP